MSQVRRWATHSTAVVTLTMVAAAGAGARPTTGPASRPARYAAVGDVVAEAVSVTARAGGRLVQTRATVGRSVRRNDLLALLDATAAAAKLGAGKQRLRDASSEMQQAQARVAAHQADRSVLEAAASKVKAVQAEILAAKRELDAANVLAPCDGVVAKLDVPLGGNVVVGQAVVELVSAGPCKVTFDVPATVAQRIRAGTAVRVESLMGTPIPPAPGVVTAVAPATGQPAGRVRVSARLAAARADLPAGSSVTVTVELSN